MSVLRFGKCAVRKTRNLVKWLSKIQAQPLDLMFFMNKYKYHLFMNK